MDSNAPNFKRVSFQSGRWIDSRQVAVPISDPAVTQAVTAVERMRAYRGHLFRKTLHLERFERTTRALAIAGLPDRDGMCRRIDELIDRNSEWLSHQNDFGVVIIASPGTGATPTLVLELYPIDARQCMQRMLRGTPIVVTDVQQPPSASWPRDIKVRCRLHYYLADRQAREEDPSALGVLLDADGTITETSVSNVLIVEEWALVSPPFEQILPGVSLQVTRELAEELGIPFHQQLIRPERLHEATEVLLTGTSCGLWFANSIDGSRRRTPGPVYDLLRKRFDREVGLA
jgi:branched-subunit amino acid aminotransferase/4-amino-4-deoxychorismate lyase